MELAGEISLLAESCWEHLTFAAKLEIGVWRQETRGRRQEERGRRKEPRGRRQEERGRRKEPEEVFLQI
ncbi:hypothetical protein [Microcoleus sp. D2_18a_B4]|uniref:hypothetical protein n=1 Tax=Microcoleus sp. D2_18a_B4 TaxID=3055329 RepID=UPI002FD6A55F